MIPVLLFLFLPTYPCNAFGVDITHKKMERDETIGNRTPKQTKNFFWCKILTQMKKAIFYRTGSRKRGVFRPVLTTVLLI